MPRKIFEVIEGMFWFPFVFKEAARNHCSLFFEQVTFAKRLSRAANVN